MRSLSFFCLAAIAAVTFLQSASDCSAGLLATQQIGLWNTGVNSSGQKLGFQQEAHGITAQRTDTDPTGSFKVFSTHPNGGWLADNASNASTWVTAENLAVSAGNPGNTERASIWEFTWNVNNTLGTDLVVEGQWASDNDAEIYLNGVSTGITRIRQFSGDEITERTFDVFKSFTITGFLAGANTLTIRLNNQPAGPEVPEQTVMGLRVEFTSAAVPEPSSLLLSGSLVVCGLCFRRRKPTGAEI